MFLPSPKAQSVACGLENGRSLVCSPARPIFFLRIATGFISLSLSLTAVCCFDNGYVGKQTVAWKEYCAQYWLKELKESMGRCTASRDVTEIPLKSGLNTVQSINQITNNVSTFLWERNLLVSFPEFVVGK